MNGLELSTTGHTLEEACNLIIIQHQHCMSSRNHQKLEPSKSKKTNLQKHKQFWKRNKLTTAMTTFPWNKVHKPGGVAILSPPLISPRIIQKHQNLTEMRRWASITINGRNKTKQNKTKQSKSHYHLCLPCLYDFH